jgi:Cu/Ag efflux pump CusA
VVIGGLVSATLLVLYVLPVLYVMLAAVRSRPAHDVALRRQNP